MVGVFAFYRPVDQVEYCRDNHQMEMLVSGLVLPVFFDPIHRLDGLLPEILARESACPGLEFSL